MESQCPAKASRLIPVRVRLSVSPPKYMHLQLSESTYSTSRRLVAHNHPSAPKLLTCKSQDSKGRVELSGLRTYTWSVVRVHPCQPKIWTGSSVGQSTYLASAIGGRWFESTPVHQINGVVEQMVVRHHSFKDVPWFFVQAIGRCRWRFKSFSLHQNKKEVQNQYPHLIRTYGGDGGPLFEGKTHTKETRNKISTMLLKINNAGQSSGNSFVS